MWGFKKRGGPMDKLDQGRGLIYYFDPYYGQVYIKLSSNSNWS